jgi:hypothetical protein
MTREPTTAPGRLEADGRLYRQVRLGFAWLELALLGLFIWSIVATQVSGYQAPLWSGLPQATAIGTALSSLLALVLLLPLWGLVRAALARVRPGCTVSGMAPASRRPPMAFLLAATALTAGCALPGPRPPESRLADVRPEQDPTSRGTARGQHIPLSEAEQVVVGSQSAAAGNVMVRQAVSPVFTPEQEEELRKAMSRGDARK